VTREIEVRRLGIVAYGDAVDLQQSLVAKRKSGAIPDQLLLLEHPPVITLGVKARTDRSHILATADELATEGVEVFESGRGGDVTYHGPGQLVGYPILDLRPDRCDVHRYVRDLEEVLIRAVRRYGIESTRSAGLTGTWVGNQKIAAIGVRIARWVTSHGFALNVSTNLAHFGLIVPCGLSDKGVTSIEQLASGPVTMASVQSTISNAFSEVFDARVVEVEQALLLAPNLETP
jgi:lipoyl(octanoyl) transferase